MRPHARQRHDSPSPGEEPPRSSPVKRESAERFMRFVSVNHDTGCWEWTGQIGRNGYGGFKDKGRKVTAHRWGYEHFAGPIPGGLNIDHLCRVRRCVNVQHLEPVTTKVNIQRGFAARPRITHCIHGHEYTQENTYASGGKRWCKKCKRFGGRNDPIVRVSS